MPGRRGPPTPAMLGRVRERRGGERARRLAGARVRDHAGVLVDHEDVLVLEDDAQRDRLGAPSPRAEAGESRPRPPRPRGADARPSPPARRPWPRPCVDQLPDPGRDSSGRRAVSH